MSETPHLPSRHDVESRQIPATSSPTTVRTGVDVQSIQRFREMEPRVARAVKRRSFTAAERGYCERTGDPPQHYAARWAAKEAFRKVVTGPVPFDAVGVERTDRGPRLALTEPARTRLTETVGSDAWETDVSLSHDRTADAAVAQLVVVAPNRE